MVMNELVGYEDVQALVSLIVLLKTFVNRKIWIFYDMKKSWENFDWVVWGLFANYVTLEKKVIRKQRKSVECNKLQIICGENCTLRKEKKWWKGQKNQLDVIYKKLLSLLFYFILHKYHCHSSYILTKTIPITPLKKCTILLKTCNLSTLSSENIFNNQIL